MVSMTSLFKRNKHADSPAGDPISLETLKQLIPIRNLSKDKLQSFASEQRSEIIAKNKTLFNINEEADSAIYLLKGTVSLSEGQNSYEIKATENQAKFPLSSGVKHTTTATAKTKISILRVSQTIMAHNSKKERSYELTIPDELKNSRLLQLFSQYYQDDELELLSLPNVAISLRKAMKKEIGIDEAVKIIQLDPVISAKLIEVANCPLYISATPAKSCFEAVKKIGLNATRSLVISLSINNLFKSKSPKIKQQLNLLWKHSLQLSSLSYVLASVSEQNDPEEALLAGLICDIGAIPFLTFVANLPDTYYNEEEINKILPVVKGVVGASLLQKWGFSDEFIQVPLHSDDWYHYSEGSLSYVDIVVLSRLHSKIGKNEMADLPAVSSIPAASKLEDASLSPQNSLRVLHDAKDKINDALKTLSAQG